MKFSNFLALFAIVLYFACEDKKSNEDKTPVESMPEIKKQEILATFRNCNPDSADCTWIRITYIEYGDDAHKAVNEFIQRKITETASDFVDESLTVNTPAEAARAFIDNFESFKTEFPEYKFAWFLTVDADVIYEDDGITSVKIDMESYTGGAHSNATTHYYILNNKTAQPLSLDEVISDTVAFKKQIEFAFRKEKNIPQDKSLYDANLDIESFSDVPCDNVGITDTAVIVHFNSYEIAPFAAGPFTIILPKENIKSILKIE